MKKKAVENTKPTETKKNGLIATVQMVKDVLVLNIYNNKKIIGRYCMSTASYEFMQWHADTEKWSYGKLITLCGYDAWYYSYYELEKHLKFNTPEEENIVKEKLKIEEYKFEKNAISLIDRRESDYSSDKRERTEQNREKRVQNLMGQISGLPEGIRDWIYERATGSADFAFYQKTKEKWSCTNCGKYYDEKFLHRVDGEKKVRHNDMVVCPRCKKIVQAKKRTSKQEKTVHFMLLQPVNEACSVARHFDVKIRWEENERKILLNESMRITLNKLSLKPKFACDIYYNQYTAGGVYSGGRRDEEYAYFDNRGNCSNRKTFAGYLYEENIEEALKDTVYEAWTRVFSQMAAAGKIVQYNRLMATQKNENMISVMEYLFKGRFDKLLLETSENVSYWSCKYCGPLRIRGQCIEDIFEIKDRQKINRIRDLNGGEKILYWMRWSEESGEKISQEVLQWLEANNIKVPEIRFIEGKMSIQKIMNYVKRQQEEGYKGKSAGAVLSQWADYMRMCERLKKKTDDEMIYRPRELKRRHDEVVAEINLREAELVADEYSRRFPGAEDVLKEIKPKFEYENEEYKIIVPVRLVDIVEEGRSLHHCAGSSDRYFDRIMQRETYICFLRKQSEPNVPYYTIEVEPSGTIRQHRGYLDEEPEIKLVKPFLREWQQALRKKLSKKDHEYAEISAVKRVQNIEELIEKNNTRVLQGLMEDFMEAI